MFKNIKWSAFVTWWTTAASLAAVVCIGWFLIENMRWFKEAAFPAGEKFDAYYSIHIHHLFLSVVKRSVALFSGFFLMFIGASICLFVARSQTEVGVDHLGLKASLATASPGIVAMFFGMLLIMQTTASKDDFPAYTPAAPAATPSTSGVADPVAIRRPLFPK